MKALSIKEPWAGKILRGEKTIETRTWDTYYRGPLLLVASKKPLSDLSGHAFAVVELKATWPMTANDEEKACCKSEEGCYSWLLEDLHPTELFEVKGQLGLYEVPDSLIKLKEGEL